MYIFPIPSLIFAFYLSRQDHCHTDIRVKRNPLLCYSVTFTHLITYCREISGWKFTVLIIFLSILKCNFIISLYCSDWKWFTSPRRQLNWQIKHHLLCPLCFSSSQTNDHLLFIAPLFIHSRVFSQWTCSPSCHGLASILMRTKTQSACVHVLDHVLCEEGTCPPLMSRS